MSSLRYPIEIQVNGERKEVSSDLSVQELLDELGLQADRVAIEIDRKLVSRRDWLSTKVRQGAEIEIVQFVGGG
jgi:sulfur carrier protein